MSTSLVETIRHIAASEVRRLLVAEIGRVTSVFPHSDEDDKSNYECSVVLKNRRMQLERVPVSTQHIGLANIPHVGDLVLVIFVGGNINAPIVIGRLYNDMDRPPLNKMEEIVYKPSYDPNPELKRLHIEWGEEGKMAIIAKDKEISIKAGRTSVLVKEDGNVEIVSEGEVMVGAQKNLTIQSTSGDISLSAKNVKVQAEVGLDMKASMASLDGSGITNIKGGIIKLN